MSTAHRLLIGAALLLAPCRVSAQTMLDLLPKDAAAAIAIRDLDGLIKKGDKFLLDTQINIPFRPSDLFKAANDLLGIQQGLNKKGSAAVILMRPDKPVNEFQFDDLKDLLVPVFPFTDADLMAANFGIAKGALQRMKITSTEKSKLADLSLPNFTKYAMRTDGHVYLSGSTKTLNRIVKGPFLTESVSVEQRKQFAESDILLHLGRYWVNEFSGPQMSFFNALKPGDDPQEKEFARQFAASAKEVQNILIGFRVDDGIDTHLLIQLSKDGQGAKLLKSLREQRQASSLRGLPDGEVFLAQASSGDAGRQAMLAKALAGFLLNDLSMGQEFIAPIDKANYLEIFHEVFRQLNGNRLAVYRNADEAKLGLFSVVAILDTEDAGRFLREMRTLMKMATAEAVDLTRPEWKAEIDIDQLIRRLGSNSFPTRQSAHTKLVLLGEHALPNLKKAVDAKDLDLETLRRVQILRERITNEAAARRKELLSQKNEPLFMRPKLTFVPKAEKRQGHNVDVIDIKIAGLDKAAKVQYTQFLGPDWDKMRLAAVGNQIVVLLGSDVSLFETALANVQRGEAGLAASKRLGAFHRHAARDRLFEVHATVEGMLRLVSPNAPIDTPLQLSSVALALGDHTLQIDVRVPTPEVRVIAKKTRGWLP
jgi:hypothetical protein